MMADPCKKVKEWKKLIFLIISAYTVITLVLYQGHFSIRNLFTTPQQELDIITSSNTIQGAIRYIPRQNNSLDDIFDIHLEHPTFGHNGETIGHAHKRDVTNMVKIAIGGGITSKKIGAITDSNIPQKFPLFNTLLPTFCKTASKNYEYHFYFAFDMNDPFFNDINLVNAFQRHFQVVSNTSCKHLTPLRMHLIQCSHTASPAWAQNDAMLEAYLDGAEFFYRINDDSQIKTAGWTEAFIQTLSDYDPKYVGVVGPKHAGGNTVILTYDFVHRTHVDIFGFYYPRTFATWWADDWVTRVYQPGRSTKLHNMLLVHTMKLGQRYTVNKADAKQVEGRIKNDKQTLGRYIKARMQKDIPKADGSKVISYSLFGTNNEDTWGAIRNAQLIPVFFPGWNVRFYIPHRESKDRVPPRIVDSLLTLGSQIAYVNITSTQTNPNNWNLLVADDEEVDVFIIRNVRTRLSDREAAAVNDWIESGKKIHCLRDHPDHKRDEITGGLWGAFRQDLRQAIGLTMAEVISQNQPDFLMTLIYPKVINMTLCHDSVHCDMKSGSLVREFPSKRIGSQYVGNNYNVFGDMADDSHLELRGFKVECKLDAPEPTPLRIAPQKHDGKLISVSGIAENVTNLTQASKAKLEDNDTKSEAKSNSPLVVVFNETSKSTVEISSKP